MKEGKMTMKYKNQKMAEMFLIQYLKQCNVIQIIQCNPAQQNVADIFIKPENIITLKEFVNAILEIQTQM